MDIRLALMSGIDVPIPECQLTCTPPKIREIAFLGEETFFSGLQYLCIKKEQINQGKNIPSETTNFQIFKMVMDNKEAVDKKINVQQVLTLCFPKYKVMFTPRALVFNLDKQNFIVDENNFDFFQSYFEQIFCLGGKAEDKFNPANAAAQKIAEKLMRGRRIVAEQKRAENGNKNVSILSQYTSILSVGLHIPLQDLLDLTIYQLYDLVERYRLWAAWDIDTRARLAGANPESQPDDWMKNLH